MGLVGQPLGLVRDDPLHLHGLPSARVAVYDVNGRYPAPPSDLLRLAYVLRGPLRSVTLDDPNRLAAVKAPVIGSVHGTEPIYSSQQPSALQEPRMRAFSAANSWSVNAPCSLSWARSLSWDTRSSLGALGATCACIGSGSK